MQSIPYTHIYESFRHIAMLPDNERIAFIDEPRWVGYQRANYGIELMQGLLNKTRQHRMPNLLVIGDANNGKTTILKQFDKKFGNSYVGSDNTLNIPVISIQSPPTPSEKDLYIAMLEPFCIPYSTKSPVIDLRYQVIHTFRECHVKVLIIDEIHSLLAGTARQQRVMMNCIKFLCNELQLPIILAGTRDAVRILHTDPQHSSRFDVFELPLWNNDKEFSRLVGSFERIMPLKKPSNLTAVENINLVYSISGGLVGNVKRLITDCAVSAIKSGEEQITIDMIKERSWLKPQRGVILA